MKNLYQVLGRFLAPEDAGTGGISAKEFFKNAPIIKGASEQEVNDPPKEESNPAEEDKQPEATQVSQPPTEEPNEENQAAEPEIVNLSEINSFKYGEETFTREDLERWRKDSQNRENWVAKLTNDGKTMSWLRSQPPEFQDRWRAYAMQHALGREKLPEGFQEKSLEFSVKLKDEYNSDIEGKYEIAPGSDEYESAKEHFYNQFMEENKSVFLELQQHQEARQRFDQDRQSYQSAESARHLREFISGNQLDFPTEGDLLKTVQDAYRDQNSPYRKTASMLVTIAQHAEAMGFDTLQAAYDDFFETKNAEKKAAKNLTEKAKKTQEGARQEKPGKSTPVKSPDDQWRESHFHGGKQSQYQRGFESLFSQESGAN